MSKKANLRTCASCEWIFRIDVEKRKRNKLTLDGCPMCGFSHYGARYVYGKDAYRYEKTQQPWIDRKVNTYKCMLYAEVGRRMKEVKFTRRKEVQLTLDEKTANRIKKQRPV